MIDILTDPLPETFRVQIDASGNCWLWTGYIHRGYGLFCNSGKQFRAHRFIWEMLVGLIPPGMTIDHMCHVKHCVNPDHLRVMTAGDNTRDSNQRHPVTQRERMQTACIHGHPFDTDNTYVTKSGSRKCRECTRLRLKEFEERRRALRRLK